MRSLSISIFKCDITINDEFIFQIRMAALDIIETFVENRGDNYLAVLPDSTSFLVEALEDDEQQVEQKCRALISKMEEVFGQSVQAYFE